MLSFLCSNNKVPINHALKFKYQPGRSKVKECVPGGESIQTGPTGYQGTLRLDRVSYSDTTSVSCYCQTFQMLPTDQEQMSG